MAGGKGVRRIQKHGEGGCGPAWKEDEPSGERKNLGADSGCTEAKKHESSQGPLQSGRGITQLQNF